MKEARTGEGAWAWMRGTDVERGVKWLRQRAVVLREIARASMAGKERRRGTGVQESRVAK